MTAEDANAVADWRQLVIAVLGGDEREQEICRRAAATGAQVRAVGFPWPEGGVKGVRAARDAAEAIAGAHVVLMPVPGIAADGSLFATAHIVPDETLLRGMAAGGHIILGRADAGLRHAAAALGIRLHEYEGDQQLMLQRAPAIAEGVIRILIENTAITLHGARICVVGQGNIGSVLTRTLIALGAVVTVAARNPLQRASAAAMGSHAINLEQLSAAASSFDIVVSTASAPIVNAALIDRMAPAALLVDLAAPPGSCDLEYARTSGRRAIWARALGRRAPITVGASQWGGIARIIEGILGEVPRDAS
jgi:dipicolinate synthase subunit A